MMSVPKWLRNLLLFAGALIHSADPEELSLYKISLFWSFLADKKEMLSGRVVPALLMSSRASSAFAVSWASVNSCSSFIAWRDLVLMRI
jgi:hypothetical protein